MGTKKTPAEEAQVDADVRPESEQPASSGEDSTATMPTSDASPDAPAAPAEAAPPVDVKAPTLLSPDAWAVKLGHARKASPLLLSNRDSKTPQARPPGFSPAHSAAAQLHGWSAHKLHTADELAITREAYEHALSAALSPVRAVDADGKPTGAPKYRPHAAALSPFSPRGNAQ